MNDTATLTRPATMTAHNFKAMAAGAMRGVFDVTLASGMVLHRCSLFVKDGRTWASPPSKQIIGRDGMVQRTQDGKTKYEPTVSFVDRATQERWSAAAIEALRIANPDALV
jgi:hypothetical protein